MISWKVRGGKNDYIADLGIESFLLHPPVAIAVDTISLHRTLLNDHVAHATN